MILFRPPCTSPRSESKTCAAPGCADERFTVRYTEYNRETHRFRLSCHAHELRRKRENAFRKRGRVATNERSGSLCVSPSTVHHYKAVSTQTRRLTVHLSNTHFSSHTPPFPPRHPHAHPTGGNRQWQCPSASGLPRASRSQRHLPRASGSASLLTPHLGPRPLATSRTSLPHLSSARRSRPARCASTTPTPSRGWVRARQRAALQPARPSRGQVGGLGIHIHQPNRATYLESAGSLDDPLHIFHTISCSPRGAT